MIGAIVGDVIGSYFEHYPTKTTNFELYSENSFFTDDTVLTVAVADWILNGGELYRYFHDYVDRYPGAGYGGTFINSARCRETEPYGSWGNGSAMRVSPVAYARDSLAEVLLLAEQTAVVTHNHPDGILGAMAVAGSVFVARQGGTKDDIRKFVESEIGYDASRSLDSIRPAYSFDVSCSGSVPESIIAFLESSSVEDAVRLAISLGGDSDTMACIAGAIAEPFYGGVPESLWSPARDRLAPELNETIEAFRRSFHMTWFQVTTQHSC
ncbi:ADP-ribosylglycohydrolase family protein [Aporhodopirellula aestuarii]|uniref:ADP-ribosylglycohydrolase family protein n=1 Tax=Aporhodopirellula aestuarii TaxID=2950107 RepID=A0ABT0U641_9BACT|nr:ADP-ribosylglycohydrolase family protein [Aporhodopirellula aestuarii]MCM2372395.1 ADP-ribosylglycohydrolase family protein [Aporhodopirellula aestuarii]